MNVMNPQHIEAVRRMQRYIDRQLHQPITLRQLAAAAGYSPYHAARMFKRLTGVAPFEYIRLRRLTQSALRLRDGGETKVLDVALDFLFDSHEGFTRAFTKAFGVAPRAYAHNPSPIRLFLPYEVGDVDNIPSRRSQRGEHNMSHPSNTIFVQVIERTERGMILRRARRATEYFAYCEEVGCDVWGVLCSVKEALYEPVGMWLPDALRPEGTSVYAQGVEVPADYSGVVPDGYDFVVLPPCKYMIFQGPPFDDDAFGDAIGDMTREIDRYDPALYGYAWDADAAPRIQLEPRGYRGYIEGRPVQTAGREA